MTLKAIRTLFIYGPTESGLILATALLLGVLTISMVPESVFSISVKSVVGAADGLQHLQQQKISPMDLYFMSVKLPMHSAVRGRVMTALWSALAGLGTNIRKLPGCFAT